MNIKPNCGIICECNVYPCYKTNETTEQKKIMIIGERPTASEAVNDRRMSGPAGDILRQTMERVGLPTSPSFVYYTTAIGCAIPKKKGAKVPKEAMLNCHKRILAEIEAVNPELILVCGAVAMQTVTGRLTLKITQEYGRLQDFGGRKLIAIMNPGLLLHAPKDYKPFLVQMTYAASVYNDEKKEESPPITWEILDTEEKMHDAHCKLMEAKIVKLGADIETTGLDYREAEVLVTGLAYSPTEVYVVPREMNHLLHNFLEDIPWHITWHNGKFDHKICYARKIAKVPIDHDTEYLHYVLDETSQHDLGYLTKVFLQAEEYKYKMNQNWKAVTLETYPQFFEALCERVAVDAAYTYQLCEKLTAQVKEFPRLWYLYKSLMIPAANFLCRVENNGILINPEYLEDLDVKYEAEMDRLLDEIDRLAEPHWDADQYVEDTGAKSIPKCFNPASSAQMAWMVFDRLKLKPRIKKGRSTAKEILNSLVPMPKLIASVLEYRTVQKEKSTYVVGLLNAMADDNRVRTNFSLHVTTTGRLSSKEPNIQNQPSANGIGNIRKAFVASPGHVLAEIDYSGAELRWLAFLSKCPVLTDVFTQGRNLHEETATSLYGPNFTKQEKMRAKAANFGIAYGREARSFAEEFEIPIEEARALVDGWLNTYPGAKEYLQWCADQVVAGHYLESPFGRRRRFGLVTKESLHALQNEARNFPIQSASSDLTLISAMCMEEQLKDWGVKIINLIHDSVLLEIPDDKELITKVGKYCSELMINAPKQLFNCEIPFTTDFEVGYNWGELKEWATE